MPAYVIRLTTTQMIEVLYEARNAERAGAIATDIAMGKPVGVVSLDRHVGERVVELEGPYLDRDQT